MHYPGFFPGAGAPLRNDVTDRWGKQILKASTKKKASSQGGGGAHPLHPPPRSAPGFCKHNFLKPLLIYSIRIFMTTLLFSSQARMHRCKTNAFVVNFQFKLNRFLSWTQLSLVDVEPVFEVDYEVSFGECQLKLIKWNFPHIQN